MGIAIWDARIRSFNGSSEMFTVANSHAVSCSISAAAPTRTGTIWRRTGPLDCSQRRRTTTIRSTEPNEITARWIVSTTLAALSSGTIARMFSPFSGTQNRSQRNSSGTTTNRKMPTMARSARDLRRPLGNDNRNKANAAVQRSVNQMPTVNTTGLGTSVIVRPSSHSIPVSTISGPRRLVGRRAQRKHAACHEGPADEHLQHGLEPDRALLGCADEHPQAQHARHEHECGANPSDGWRIAHERSRSTTGWTAPVVGG